jgi:DNA-binding Lrp family transcriptional regulator
LRDTIVKIDIKDKKILYHLINNSRQSFNSIGKKVGLSKNVVDFRIKKLENKGIIVEYPTVINSRLLGWGDVRFYYTFQFASPEKKQEIIDYFIHSDIVTHVTELEGSYDLQINVYVTSLRNFEYPSKYRDLFLNFSSFYDQTQKKYRKYFDEQIMIAHHKSEWFDPILLLGDKILKPSYTPRPPSPIEIKIDKLDFDILQNLAVNARIPTVKLAHDLNVTTKTIKNRIKKLIEEKVVLGFGVLIDLSKTQFREYVVEINLKDYDKKYEIIEYIRKYQNIIEITESFGRGVDLDFRFVLEDITQLQENINNLSSEFPDTIKNFRYYSRVKIHKYNFMPFK